MPEGYCLLTGDRCSQSLTIEPYTFFISEPYDRHRLSRERSITEAIKGYKYIISDSSKENISITCKICRQIQSCYFGIVDITSLNKNVLIELGMLYGFQKPTIILVKLPTNLLSAIKKIKIEIPSNIIGIEQIRYKDFADLQEKMKEALKTLFEIAKKQEAYLLDLKPQLKLKIQQLEIAIITKKAIASHLEGQLQFYRSVDQTPTFILNKGTKDGLKDNIILSVFKLVLVEGQNYLEEEVGRIVIKNAQEKLSQCTLWFVNPNSQDFWSALIGNLHSTKNIVRPFINQELEKLSEKELVEYASKLKIVLDGFSINELKV